MTFKKRADSVNNATLLPPPPVSLDTTGEFGGNEDAQGVSKYDDEDEGND